MSASKMMPSKTLVIDTKTPQGAAKAIGKEDEQQPMSPGPLSPYLYLKEDKDMLAYEHDRQKYKKTLDRAKNKARKAFTWGNGSGEPPKGSHTRGRSSGHGQQTPSIKAGEEDKELASEYFQGGPQAQRRKNSVTNVGVPFTEVKLADLVVLAASDESTVKVRGATKKKTTVGRGGLDGEFEVIPHVRSVIVLDDQHFTKEQVPYMDLGEAWECVEDEESSDDGAEKKILARATYARVAAAGVEAK